MQCYSDGILINIFLRLLRTTKEENENKEINFPYRNKVKRHLKKILWRLWECVSHWCQCCCCCWCCSCCLCCYWWKLTVTSAAPTYTNHSMTLLSCFAVCNKFEKRNQKKKPLKYVFLYVFCFALHSPQGLPEKYNNNKCCCKMWMLGIAPIRLFI